MSVKFLERAVKRTTTERMQREVGLRSFKFERSARRRSSKSRAGFLDLGGVRHEERASSEVSIARQIGERDTAPVCFHDLATRSESNQALEPTPTAVTIPADAGFAPAAVVAHL